jgi:glycyl-tRNA synthetase
MPLNFQSIILKLQEFWAARGCLIWQPYYTQVGAGTLNPATSLRVLGPEPWNVAYVEPSVRPDDGRYGENPNRFQLHYQFQVILKPDPGNPQELYLDSLKAIGIDPRQHDIRFVEDKWEQPAISAWGLGWEVWLDGQEITQFTYFQQVGGQALDPVAVEMTYGLERILIALRNAASIWDEPWNDQISYGEVRRLEEYEHSKYYFETADIERLRQMYNLFEAEAESCLAQGIILPAYDYVLKCSHAFNVLDVRGAIGVTERQAYFGRMRDIARRVAQAYLEQRQRLEFPLLKQTLDDGQQTTGYKRQQTIKPAPPSFVDVEIVPSSFLLEIGTEELPVGDLDSALAQLTEGVPVWLDEIRLEYGKVSVFGTPRRLIVFVEALAPRQADIEQVIKGPPVERAYDASGKVTQAAVGFARSKGVDISDLQVREMDGGNYVVAVVKAAGRGSSEVLTGSLPGLVTRIKFDNPIRWNDSNAIFSRPIRWLVAMLGEAAIPFEYAGVQSGKVTRGLRPHGSPEIEINSADEYFEILRQNGIVYDPTDREELIKSEVEKLADSISGEAIITPELLNEVANLVEKPTSFLGSFNPEYLSLPKGVLISVMTKHQRYFPVQKKGKLLPNFIAVRNGDDQDLDLVRQGNEHVIGARFSDANFFVREDVKQPLEAYRTRLGTLTFQTRLGSMLDKVERIEKLTAKLIPMLHLQEDEGQDALRAAHLCKADLVTRMVVEMTSLQGIMGGEYALRSGERQAVATAIGEQYLAVPRSMPGLAVALADRLDSLIGLFAAGLAPSGTKDPFGLRRAALGVVQPLLEHDLDFDLRQALQAAAETQPIPVSNEVREQVLEFITGRLRVWLIETGFRYDVVEAVLAVQAYNPAKCVLAAKQLSKWVARSDWSKILPAYARCVRITRDQKTRYKTRQDSLVEDAEHELFTALEKAESTQRSVGSVDDFLNSFLPMIPSVDKFFVQVLVMTEDKDLQANRLGLLQRITALADGTVDMSKLEGF